MSAVGERFRAAREARGMSLSDVAEQIRIRAVYLAAIEEENWGAIGAPVYVRGFLRTYARFLGLDPEDAVAAFNEAAGHRPAGQTEVIAAHPPSRAASPTGPAGERRSLSPLIWFASAVAIVLIAFVIYNFVTTQRGQMVVASASTAPASTAVPQPSGSPLPSPSPVAVAMEPKTLEIRFTALSWLRVTVDGHVSIEGTFGPGTTKTVHGKSALVRVGNAGGVEIMVDGKNVGKLGGNGDVVERMFTL